jgi:murein DD-endopeptidase MepM/ murein hydrolase activator NlpD
LVIPQTGLPELPTFMKNCGVNPITGTPGFIREPQGTTGHSSFGTSGRPYFTSPRRGNDGIPYPHGALDIAADPSNVVVANRAGAVVRASDGGDRAGNIIDINHGDGFYTRHLHLREIQVAVGTQLTQGESFSHSGNTRRPENVADPHLHFEVWYGVPRRAGSIRLDPEFYLNNPCHVSVPLPLPPS